MIDLEYFGYGVGIVLSAWVIGTCVSCVFSIFRRF
jgi:hypothetical protein